MISTAVERAPTSSKKRLLESGRISISDFDRLPGLREEFLAIGYERAIDQPMSLVMLTHDAQQLCAWLPAGDKELLALMRTGHGVLVGTYCNGYVFTPFVEFAEGVIEDVASTREELQQWQ